jgi:hypothetical protein
MLTFELVSKKRKPIKRYAFYGIITGILLLILIGLTGHWIAETIKVIIMILVAFTFIICLYIINYSVKFKNAIGHIFFSEEYIEIELLRKIEIIYINDISKIRFKLAGYEGLNNSTIRDILIWPPGSFSYHSGLNNFVYIFTINGVRTLEIYLKSKKEWYDINNLAKLYNKHFKIN